MSDAALIAIAISFLGVAVLISGYFISKAIMFIALQLDSLEDDDE